VAREQRHRDNARPEKSGSDHLRVLIVEDEAYVAVALAATLEELGAEAVASVRNGYAAIALAERHHPDVVLMDVTLDGDMDGIEAARIIRDQLQVPIIFITGMDNPVTELRIAEMGGAELLCKPADGDALGAALQRAALRKATRKTN
jgi:DNA-binding response OmpR family regulator